jgi:hypothetical protein
MPGIAKSVVTLRIFGDTLLPEEVAPLIGSAATNSYRKGDVERMRSGRTLVRKTGVWQLQVNDREPEDINAQVAEILARLTPDLSVWRSLCQQYEVDLFCGLFMNDSNEGLSLSVPTLMALGERGIELGFDVYGPTRELESNALCPCGSGTTYVECCAPKREA